MKNLMKAIHRAEKGMKLTPEGNGSYKLPDMTAGGTRSPAQQMAVKKAAQASAMKRKLT